MTALYGGAEAGGTKWVCAVGSGPDHLVDTVTFPTTTPEETIGRAAAFFERHPGIAGLGIGSFGPIDVERGSIGSTPKAGWSGVPVVAELEEATGCSVAFDTDVNAAALGELRWGAATGLDTFCYVTVGTGIGGGAVVDGRLLHGLVHPEFGHMRIPHDTDADPFPGVCPFHGDCLEGLASGESIRRRWGRPGAELADEDAVWRLEAEYLALGLANVIAVLSPQRIVLGGGVMKTPGLLERVRARVGELVGGYVETADVVAPALGDRAGVVGALELARAAFPRAAART